MTASNRLHLHMAGTVALETSIAENLGRLSKQATTHPDVAAMLESVREMSVSRRQALETRLQALVGNMDIPDRALVEFNGKDNGYPVSAALQQASMMNNQAIFDYAMLRSIALRFCDSHVAGEGSTGDLAGQHTESCIRAAHRITRMLHDVVVWELDQEGSECQCTCPCCGLGICLCSVSARTNLGNAWATADSGGGESEVFVHPPRSGSAAASASLNHGDVIVAIDGQELQSYSTLQGAVREHRTGESIELRVRRASGEVEDVTVICP
jgi:hypothetical protein